MADISKPHNNLFIKTMESKEALEEFLKLNLPQKIIEKLKFDTLRDTGNSYVADELEELFSDIVYKVDLKDGKEVYITFLLEHKSSPERRTVLQIYRYLARIWNKEYDNNKILPVIIPILFYHGEREWKAPQKLSGLMEGDISWAEEIIPDFKYYLFTLSDLVKKIPEMTVPKLKLYIKALRLPKSENREDFFNRFDEFWQEAVAYVDKSGEEVILRYSFRYIMITVDQTLVSGEEIEKEARRITPERSDIVGTIAEEYIERGKKEELQKIAIKLSISQFQGLSEKYKQKIKEQDIEELEKLVENIIKMEKEEDLEKYLD